VPELLQHAALRLALVQVPAVEKSLRRHTRKASALIRRAATTSFWIEHCSGPHRRWMTNDIGEEAAGSSMTMADGTRYERSAERSAQK
jgi:hypothetical protein